jgi:hypothetical protein
MKQGVLAKNKNAAGRKVLGFVREFLKIDFEDVLSMNFTDVREETEVSSSGERRHVRFCQDEAKSER